MGGTRMVVAAVPCLSSKMTISDAAMAVASFSSVHGPAGGERV